MLPSSSNFLDKMMETMIMQMFNNQCKYSTPACHNRTCVTKLDQKSRKRRKHHRHCKKKRSKCPTDDGVASIICITKCMKKSKKPQENTKCPNPCSPGRKSRSVRMASCSSDSSASDPKYCSKCGQPLPGSTVSQMKSPDGLYSHRETHTKMYVKGLPTPEETCISCHTETHCTQCQRSKPIRSQQNIVGQCVPDAGDLFGPPYLLGNLNNSKPDGLCGGYNGNNIELTGVEKQKKCLVQVTCCGNTCLNTCSANKICSPPPVDGKSNYPAAVRIKRCGKNIVTVRCDEGGDFDDSCLKTNSVGLNYSKRIISDINVGIDNCENDRPAHVEETQRSRRFIHITEDQRSDYDGNCITKVRCADYSSITSGAIPSSNRNCATEVPVVSSSSGRASGNKNIGYSPCTDRDSSAVHPNSSPCHNMKSQHVVRLKFVKPRQHGGFSTRDFDCCCEIHGSLKNTNSEICCKPDDYESDCDAQPSCTCCVTKDRSRPPALPFCYDPAIDHYDNECCDLPCHCLDEPLTTNYLPNPPLYSQPPPPVYDQPYEYRPVSQSSSASSDTEESLPPDDRYGYDFFYGTVRPSMHSGEKKSSYKSS